MDTTSKMDTSTTKKSNVDTPVTEGESGSKATPKDLKHHCPGHLPPSWVIYVAGEDHQDHKPDPKTKLTLLLQQFTTEYLHPNCPYETPEVLMTHNTVDAYTKIFNLITTPWSEERNWVGERDGAVSFWHNDRCSRFRSPSLSSGNRSQKVTSCCSNTLRVSSDRGVRSTLVQREDPSGFLVLEQFSEANLLDAHLRQWEFWQGKRPHLLFIGACQWRSPRSRTLSDVDHEMHLLQKMRRDLYNVCKEWDLLIVEDASGWLVDDVNMSFMELDVDGRVIRVDSFEEPGKGEGAVKLAWITAQPAIIERLRNIEDNSSGAPCELVQNAVAEKMFGTPASAVDAHERDEDSIGDRVSHLSLAEPPSKISINLKPEQLNIQNMIQRLKKQGKITRQRVDIAESILRNNQFLYKETSHDPQTPNNNDKDDNNKDDETKDWTQIHKTTLYNFATSKINPAIHLVVNMPLHFFRPPDAPPQPHLEELWESFFRDRTNPEFIPLSAPLTDLRVFAEGEKRVEADFRLYIADMESEQIRKEIEGIVREIRELHESEAKEDGQQQELGG